MPKGHKDPGILVTEITMTRTLHRGAFLIVEGSDDIRFWTARKGADCELVDGEGKPNVVEGIQKLETQNFEGALGVVDDDYDSLLGIDHGSRNLVATDTHDLECLLCRSSALDSVLAEFGNPSRIRRFEEDNGTDVRTGLLNRALVFGCFRWSAARLGLSIDHDIIRVPRFTDQQTWDVDHDGLMRAVSQSGSVGSGETLAREIAQLPPADPWRIVRGHDVMEILRIGLRRVLGELPASVGKNQIARVLRAAMSREELEETTLWADMRKWETENRPYRVL